MSADQDAGRGREEEGVSSGREMAETATAAVEGSKEETEVKEEVVLVEEEEEDDTPVDLSAFWIKPDQVSSSFAGQFVSLLQSIFGNILKISEFVFLVFFYRILYFNIINYKFFGSLYGTNVKLITRPFKGSKGIHYTKE